MGRNSYFKFKQFTIVQEKTAMKVGTDGVLLGAWSNVLNAQRILDIGTGTGLVSLMLAQRTAAEIIAVEIDEAACLEANFNVANSPWYNRITIVQTTFQEYQRNNSNQFDLIVCNPPYFSNSHKAFDARRTIARHNDTLPPRELLSGVSDLLTDNGSFCIVLPSESESTYRNIAADYRLFASRIMHVKPTRTKPSKRILIEFCFEAQYTDIDELVIASETDTQYSPQFIDLLKDYYLAM